jgi:predicted lipoprotein with Yx(FWY)xxD motif
MNSTGVVHRRGFAILVLLAAVALAAYLVHARLGDDTAKERTGSSGKAAPVAVNTDPPTNGPAYGADAGSGDGYGGAAPATSAPANAAPAAPAAPVGFKTTSLTGKNVPRMGNVVVDSGGWTLYRFDQDTANPPKSNCNGACAQQWPPVTVDGDPQIAGGIDKNKVGTVTRDDGSKQLTLNGWPMYRFAADGKAGAWKGQAVKNVWWVIASDGTRNLSCLPEGAVPPTS